MALDQHGLILRQAIPQKVMFYALVIICSKIIWNMLLWGLSACHLYCSLCDLADVVLSSVVKFFSCVQRNVMLMKITSKINDHTLWIFVITFMEVFTIHNKHSAQEEMI